MPSAFVRDLGIYVDADVSMRIHVAKTVSSCFAVLRHLRYFETGQANTRRRLDYENATLAELADQSLVNLQSVLNAAARLIILSDKFDHVAPLLYVSYWLRCHERIYYKLALLVFITVKRLSV